MPPPSSSPRLFRPIFVSPSTTVLMHDVTAEWDALHARETLTSRGTAAVLSAATDLQVSQNAGPSMGSE